MRLARRPALLLAVPLVLAVGCGDDSSEPEAATPPAASGGDEVVIENFDFDPGALEVEVGTTVRWTNGDGTTHTVTGDGDDSALSSGDLGAGDTFEHTFEEAGDHPYHCEIHPSMTATVTVTG